MPVPRGVIFVWSGAIVDIPPGYLLCDGNNDTPDLRDQFLIGAGDTYAPDDTGGAASHDHAFISDGHDHDLPGGSGVQGGVNWSSTTNTAFASGTTDPASSLPPYYALAYIMKT